MSVLNFSKVPALPAAGSLTPNTLYLVAAASGYMELHVTASSGSPPAVRHIPTTADITTMIANAMADGGRSKVVADITARNALTAAEGLQALVVDATGDPTVHSGAATYIYNGTVWVKISEAESMDLSLAWASIVGGPSSTPAQLDAAVGASHGHSNKAVLDKFTESGGVPLYNGVAIPVTLLEEGW